MKGFFALRAVFFLLVRLKSHKRLMVWLGAFIWVLAHKEKEADITSKTKSQPKQKGFCVFFINHFSTKLTKNRFYLILASHSLGSFTWFHLMLLLWDCF